MIRFDAHHQLFEDNFVLSGTGSRFFKQHQDPHLLDLCCLSVQDLQEHNPDKSFLVVSGGAQGWDRYLTKIAVKMQIPFVLVIPSPEFPGYYWSPRGSVDHLDWTSEWEDMADRAVEIMYVNSSFIGRNGRPGGSNFDRNEALVEVADHFLVWNTGTSGTLSCLRRIRAEKVSYTDMTKQYNDQPGAA